MVLARDVAGNKGTALAAQAQGWSGSEPEGSLALKMDGGWWVDRSNVLFVVMNEYDTEETKKKRKRRADKEKRKGATEW